MASPSPDIVTDELVQTFVYDGGYIPDLELRGSTLLISTFQTMLVYDINPKPAQFLDERINTSARAVAMDPSAEWVAFVSGGADGDAIDMWNIEEISGVSPPVLPVYRYPYGTRRINDVVLDSNQVSYAATGEGTIWFADFDGVDIIPAHTGGATTVGLSIQEQFASSGMDGTLKFWSGQTLTDTFTLGQPVLQIEWSPVAADVLALRLEDGQLKIWQSGSISDLPAQGTTFVWSPDAAQLAVGQEDGSVQVWDVATQTQIATIAAHPYSVTALAWDADKLVSAGLDGRFSIWDSNWQLVESIYAFKCCGSQMQNLTGNGERFLFEQGAVVWQWDNTRQELETIFFDRDESISQMKLSPSGNYLVTSEAGSPQERFIRVYQWDARTHEYQILASRDIWNKGSVIAFNFLSGESHLLILDMLEPHLTEYTLPNLDIVTEHVLIDNLYQMTLTPVGQVALIANNGLIVFTGETLVPIQAIPLSGVYSTSYSPNGRYLAVGTNVYTAVVDWNDTEYVNRTCSASSPFLSDPRYYFSTYHAFVSDSTTLVCANSELEIFDLSTNQPLRQYPLSGSNTNPQWSTNGLELSSDESQVFLLFGNQFQIWEVELYNHH